MALPYNGNIPQAGDIPANSQPQILNNFASIQTLIDQDHVDFTGIVPGQHDMVSLVTQGTYPVALPVFNPLGMIGLFSAVDPNTSKNELYINKTNASGIVQVASTESVLGITAAPSPGTTGGIGWTLLPSGIKFVWGQGTSTTIGAGNATVNLTNAPFGAPYAFANSIINVVLTPIGTSPVFVQVNSIPNPNIFTVNCLNSAGVATSGIKFNFLAVGY